MSAYTQIRDLIEQMPFVDTHEHLIEESVRLTGNSGWNLFPCDDWAYLFWHYFGDDLASAGMPKDDHRRFFSPGVESVEKYRLVAPWWERAKHTGYGQAVRHTLQGLYTLDDLTEETVPLLAERYREMVKPGFYREILVGRSGVESCQVNSLMHTFCETAQPDLLEQDLSIVPLSTGLNPRGIVQETGKTATDLDGWLEIIDWHFATYGPRAVAVKNQSAYARRLDYDAVPKETAAPLFVRQAAEESLSPEESKTLQDYLMRYCIGKATEFGLPVKLHTGYYAGHSRMPLERVRQNAGDLCPLLHDFPDTKFVLMHIGYPYQDEYIALAKQYPNVFIDLCWAWIINPQASIRFVKEFLTAAPANKLFTFGGDYITVEPVYGHSRIARLGLTQALTQLVEGGWLRQEETPDLIERLMRGNAHATFPKPAS